jgi:asparagine synthase (glutamine-hydrolysing)
LNRLAREIAPIRMTGNYGSEVLRNVGSLKADLPDLGIFDDEFSKHLIAAKSTLDTNASGNPLTMLLTKRIPWQMNGRFKLEQSQLTTRIPFLDNDIVQLAYKMPDENCSNSKMSLNLIRDYNFLLSKIPTDQGIGGICNPIFSKILSTYRQATFKAEYVYNYGMPQWLAKTDHLFAPFHLEKLFLGRHKFQYFRIWFRDYLADYLKGILLDKNAFLRTYMKNGIQEEIVTKHINGTGNYTTEIDKLLTIEIVNSLLLKN